MFYFILKVDGFIRASLEKDKKKSAKTLNRVLSGSEARKKTLVALILKCLDEHRDAIASISLLYKMGHHQPLFRLLCSFLTILQNKNCRLQWSVSTCDFQLAGKCVLMSYYHGCNLLQISKTHA